MYTKAKFVVNNLNMRHLWRVFYVHINLSPCRAQLKCLMTKFSMVTIPPFISPVNCELCTVRRRRVKRKLPHARHPQDGALGEDGFHRLPAPLPLHPAPGSGSILGWRPGTRLRSVANFCAGVTSSFTLPRIFSLWKFVDFLYRS